MATPPPHWIEVPERELAGPLAPFPPGEILDALWSQGYERIEVTERLTREATTNDYPDHVRLWLRCLALSFRLFDYLSNVPLDERAPLDPTARQLRFRLFTFSVGGMKVALDNTLGGYYAQAWGQIRYMAECHLQMMHARFRPQSSIRWFESEEAPRRELTCENAIEAVEARAEQYLDREDALIWAEGKRLYNLGHKGAHPTSAFLWQTLGDEEWSFVLGSNYNARAAQATLFWGVDAIFLLLGELLKTEKGDESILSEHIGIMREHDRLFSEFNRQAEDDVSTFEGIEEDDPPA